MKSISVESLDISMAKHIRVRLPPSVHVNKKLKVTKMKKVACVWLSGDINK